MSHRFRGLVYSASKAEEFVDEILNGQIGELSWRLEQFSQHAVSLPMCAGHLYGDPVSKGPVPSDVMVIGKMPRPADIEADCCFGLQTGAGRFLADEAREAGVDMSSWYVTYLLKTPHPVDPARGSGLRSIWTRDSFWLLKEEIRRVSPKCLLLLGTEVSREFFGPYFVLSKAKSQVFPYAYVDSLGRNQKAKVAVCGSAEFATLSDYPEPRVDFRQSFQFFCSLLTQAKPSPQQVAMLSECKRPQGETKEMQKLRRSIQKRLLWDINLNSVYELRELLYGTKYNGNKVGKRMRPKKAISFGLSPLFDTQKRLWNSGLDKQVAVYAPSCSIRVLLIHAKQFEGVNDFGRKTLLDIVRYKQMRAQK